MHRIEVEMCRQLLNYCLIYYLLVLSVTDVSSGDLFLVTPGDGQEFVYSPVDVNVTLHCAVTSMELSWEVGDLNFNTAFHRRRLHSRGIFQTETVTSSEGVTTSNVTVFGNLAENNGSELCCQSERDSIADIVKECTIIIIYGPPSPPELVPLQFHGKTLEINISWTALTVTGVDQNYTIYFDKEIVETIHSFYSYQQTTSDSKIRCSVYVTAVNAAGESDPSNNVTIPSLPDIGPVTASLSHQVWKSAGGEIMVNVLFEPALYCVGDPVLEYIVTLMSDSEVSRDKITKVLLGSSKTEVTIESSDGLKENLPYLYKVTARNSVGNTTSSGKMFRSLHYSSPMTGIILIVIITVAILILVIIVTVVITLSVILMKKKKGGNKMTGVDKVKWNCNVTANSNCQTNKSDESTTLSQYEALPLQNVLDEPDNEVSHQRSLQYSPSHSPIKTLGTYVPVKCHEQNVVADTNSDASESTIRPPSVPLYAVPDKFKIKEKTENHSKFCLQKEMEEPGTNVQDESINNEENIYHVLENNRESSKNEVDVMTTASPASEPSPPLVKDVSPPLLPVDPCELSIMYESTAANDTEDCNTDLALDVPVYAVPDKVRSKTKSVLSKNNGASAQQEDTNEVNDAAQEHIYHVLENDRAPPKTKLIPPDSDTPDLRSSFQPSGAPPPVYQDITEINTKK